MSNAHEQFQNQRELARLQRWHHGEETALDRAEIRHEAIYNWIMNARFLVPLGLIFCVGWIGNNPSAPWLLSVGTYCITMAIAFIIARIWDGIVGKFREDDVLIKTQHWWFTAFGLMIAAAGTTIGPGMVLAGIIQAATPYVWTRWARRVYQNTDYSRLKASMREPDAPRLYE